MHISHKYRFKSNKHTKKPQEHFDRRGKTKEETKNTEDEEDRYLVTSVRGKSKRGDEEDRY